MVKALRPPRVIARSCEGLLTTAHRTPPAYSSCAPTGTEHALVAGTGVRRHRGSHRAGSGTGLHRQERGGNSRTRSRPGCRRCGHGGARDLRRTIGRRPSRDDIRTRCVTGTFTLRLRPRRRSSLAKKLARTRSHAAPEPRRAPGIRRAGQACRGRNRGRTPRHGRASSPGRECR